MYYHLVSQVYRNVAILIGHIQLGSLLGSLEAPTRLWSIVTRIRDYLSRPVGVGKSVGSVFIGSTFRYSSRMVC